MIKAALQANIPIIAVQTNDVIHVKKIIEHHAGLQVDEVSEAIIPTEVFNDYDIFIIYDDEQLDYHNIYKRLLKKEKILIVVNPQHDHNTISFNAGALDVPLELLLDVLEKLDIAKSELDSIIHELKGLTLKQVHELLNMTNAEFGDLKPKHLNQMRIARTTTPTGVLPVSLDYLYYHKLIHVTSWVQKTGPLLKNDNIIKELRPRGLLFHGTSGCGKTLSAKYIAKELKIPLYLLDISCLLNKYIGESERNLRQAFRFFAETQPCVVLIDEVEKLFKTSDDSGVGNKLLAQILWWLQEHIDKVLTIMTTNDLGKLPIELYRAGRIDEKFEFSGIPNYLNIVNFADNLWASLIAKGVNLPPFNKNTFENKIMMFGSGMQPTHAEITKKVYEYVQQLILKGVCTD